METRINLKYFGPAVDSGHMDVYQVSTNMVAFSEFVTAACKVSFGDQVQTKAEVAAFGRGSFITDLLFSVVGPAASIFSAMSPEQLLTVIKGAFDLWKHLGGQPPKEVKHENNQTVKVTNNNGQIIQIQTQSLNIVMNEKASEAVRQFVREPLSREGIEGVQIETERQPLTTVSQEEGYCFVPVLASETVTDNTMQQVLTIEGPMFKDGNKWRFNDGQSSFLADILDKEFLSRVDGGEPFSKGDLLTVKLRLTQERAGMKLTTVRTVVQVVEHRSGPTQAGLFGS